MHFQSRIPDPVVVALALLVAGAALAKQQEPPEITEDGLHRVEHSKLALVYVDPKADFSIYSDVLLLGAHVASVMNWQRDQNRNSTRRISTGDMEDIKTISNRAAARRILRDWAQILRNGLDTAHTANRRQEGNQGG